MVALTWRDCALDVSSHPSFLLLIAYTQFSFFFFFNDTAPPEIYPLSLHDALPISETAGAHPLFARSAGASAEAPAPASSRGLPSLALLGGAAGAAIALSYATVEQFVIPVRGSREVGLDRAGIARLLMLGPGVDVLALLPLGALADRRGLPPVLGGVLLVFAAAVALVAFGSLPLMAVGCALFGFSMAGWTLPLGILRRVTPPAQGAWRTALSPVAGAGGEGPGPPGV